MTLPPWMEPAAQRLMSLQESGRLPHALLLTAPTGWGELSLARWLSGRLLNLDAAQDPALVAHPDLRWVEPDRAMIRVDQVREVAEFAVGTRQLAPCKVAVFVDAHSFNIQAANALLKTLEEPPPHTFIILASDHPGRLLPTLRSRCQRIAIVPQTEQALDWAMAEARRLDPELQLPGAQDLDVLAFEYGAAPHALLAALRRGVAPLAGLLRQIQRRAQVSPLVNQMMGDDPHEVTGRWLRYVVALQAGQGPLADLQPAPRALQDFADELIWIRRQLEVSNSVNVQLMFERLLVRWKALAG